MSTVREPVCHRNYQIPQMIINVLVQNILLCIHLPSTTLQHQYSKRISVVRTFNETLFYTNGIPKTLHHFDLVSLENMRHCATHEKYSEIIFAISFFSKKKCFDILTKGSVSSNYDIEFPLPPWFEIIRKSDN